MKKVLLIYGGASPEHEISCKSAQSIIENIDKTKYELECIYITPSNEWTKENKPVTNIIEYLKQFDVVFPIIHGCDGEDGKLQGMLDLFRIKYVGSKWGPSYICMDKGRTKQILKYYNIPQVPFQIYDKKENLIIPFPVIIKPANGGSSIGIKIAHNKKEYKKAISEASKYDKKIIVEKYINAQELECAILEDNNLIISNIGEIITENNFYDYDTKYNKNTAEINTVANIPNEVKKQIKKYAKFIFDKLNLNVLARIDFLYDKDFKKLYLNEINTLPGFTTISMYPKLIMDKGFTYKDLITKLIENVK